MAFSGDGTLWDEIRELRSLFTFGPLLFGKRSHHNQNEGENILYSQQGSLEQGKGKEHRLQNSSSLPEKGVFDVREAIKYHGD